jgi:hypothetical protein
MGYNRKRKNFNEKQVDTVLKKQGGKCPCCGRSLTRVKCGWDAHHRNGNPSDNSTSNCVCVCVDCHHNCYHDEKEISRKPIKCRVITQ